MQKTNLDTNLKDKSFEKLARGSYYLILDNMVTVALGALFWIAMAKFVAPTMLGQTMVIMGVASSMIAFTGTAIQVTISKYVSEYNAKNMPSYSKYVLKLGLKIALLVSIIASVVIAVLSEVITTNAYKNPTLAPLLAMAVLTFVPSQTVVLALMGAYQGSQKMKYTLITDLIYQSSRIILAILFVYYGLNNFGILISFLIASAVASVVGYLYYIPRIFPRLSKDDSKNNQQEKEKVERPGWHLVKFSGFNYIASGMRTLSVQIGILILGTQSFEWSAFYGVAVLITSVVGGIMTAVARAILPTASEHWTKGDKEELKHVFNVGIRLSLLLSGFGLLIVVLDPKQILGLISSSYIQAFEALRILAIGTIVSSISSVMISIINATGKAGVIAKIEVVTSIAIIALAFVLTPIIGLQGAAVAMLIGSSINLTLASIVLRKQGLSISATSIVRPAASIIIGLITGLLLSQLLPNSNIIIVLGVAIATYWAMSIAIRATNKAELAVLFRLLFRVVRS